MNKILLVLIGSSFLLSCNNDELSQDIQDGVQKQLILKERDAKYPLQLESDSYRERHDQGSRTSYSINDPLDAVQYLGRGFKITTVPVADVQNLTWPVVDLEKFERDFHGSIAKKPMLESSVHYFSYANFDRYSQNSSTTKKIDGGFKIKLWAFSIGAKRKMTEVFTKSIVEESNRVFGELNIDIRKYLIEMQTSSNILRNVSTKYMHPVFLDEMYNTPVSELSDNYGDFVLFKLVTGGRATALYTAVDSESQTLEKKEKNLNTDIEASFSFKKDQGSVGADVGFGKDRSNGSAHQNKTRFANVSIKTYGGSSGVASFTVPKSIDDISINLSSWAASVDDVRNQVFVDVADSGLVALSSLIIENNFQKQMVNYLQDNYKGASSLMEPTLNIVWMAQNNSGLVVLNTRFGDQIRLEFVKVPTSADRQQNHLERDRVLSGLINKYSEIYGLKVTNFLSNSGSRSVFSFENLDETKMKKCLNTDNGLTYLMYAENGHKFAYSIYQDFILDTYGMRDFVNSLPVKEITSRDLVGFTIIGL